MIFNKEISIFSRYAASFEPNDKLQFLVSFDFWYLELKLLGELYFFLLFFVKLFKASHQMGWTKTQTETLFISGCRLALVREISTYRYFLLVLCISRFDILVSRAFLWDKKLINGPPWVCCVAVEDRCFWGQNAGPTPTHWTCNTDCKTTVEPRLRERIASTLSLCFPSICFDRVETNFSISRWFRVPLHKITEREQCNRAMFVKITLETFQNALFICSSNVGSQQFRHRYRKKHVIVECF